jgi:hypothetical protein
MNKLPFARTTDIVIQTSGKELLIYDLIKHKAFNLNETSAIVYQACDGKTSFSQLMSKTKFSEEIIFLALDELRKENLIEANSSYTSPFAGMTRREVIRKVGFASMIALPVISSLIAPTAAHAQSAATSCGTSCTHNSDCVQGCRTCLGVCPGSGESCLPERFCNATGVCGGSARCSSGGSPCINVGGPCGFNNSGICTFSSGRCSAGGVPCFTLGGPCTGRDTCSSLGTCQ